MGSVLEAVKEILEREMVRQDRMKSVGKVEVVALQAVLGVSGEDLRAVNTNKQPKIIRVKILIFHNADTEYHFNSWEDWRYPHNKFHLVKR